MCAVRCARCGVCGCGRSAGERRLQHTHTHCTQRCRHGAIAPPSTTSWCCRCVRLACVWISYIHTHARTRACNALQVPVVPEPGEEEDYEEEELERLETEMSEDFEVAEMIKCVCLWEGAVALVVVAVAVCEVAGCGGDR